MTFSPSELKYFDTMYSILYEVEGQVNLNNEKAKEMLKIRYTKNK